MQQILLHQDPVRDRGWWIRTAVYVFVLFSQDVTWSGPPHLMAVTILATVACGVGIVLRDRYPWLLVTISTLIALSFAYEFICFAVVMIASRGKLQLLLPYSFLASVLVFAPWLSVEEGAISVTTPGGEPVDGVTKLVAQAFSIVIFVIIPALIGRLRYSQRNMNLQRLAFEGRQRESAANEAVVLERNRIAQEMHDVLGHKLSLITMQAGALQVNPDADADTIRSQADLIRQTAKAGLDELRVIVGVLGDDANDPTRPQPVLDDLEELIAHNRASGARIDSTITLPDSRPDQQIQTAAYRIVQEGLTNAAKYAPGAKVRITVAGEPGDGLTVEVANRKSAREPQEPGSGRGLAGLGERVRAAGGVFTHGALDDGGFRISASLPWEEHV